MGEFDLNTYQLHQQLLSGEAHSGSGDQEGPAACFFQPPPPAQPSMLGGHGQWVVDPDPAGYLAAEGFSALTQPLQITGGGAWAGNDDGFVQGGGVAPGPGEAWTGEESRMLGGDAFPGNNQSVHGGGVPHDLAGGLQDLLMSSVDMSKFDDTVVNSLWASAMMDSLAAHPSMYAHPPMVPAAEPNQPASDSSGPSTQVGEDDLPGLTSQMPVYPPTMEMVYSQPPLLPASVDIPQAVTDEEEAEVALIVRAAARCGDDKASTVWSEQENQLLRDGLSRFAGQDNVTKCFNIASGLVNKTVLDVAYRIRWLSDLEKKRAAKQSQLEPEKTAEAKVTKGKGAKGATRKNNKYPLSKEVLDSKSAKDLIRDNDRLMDKIEEILRTGQLKNSPDYFYYVKMNMDALLNKVTDVATVMEGLSVDDEEWADVLKDRSSSSASKDMTAAPFHEA